MNSDELLPEIFRNLFRVTVLVVAPLLGVGCSDPADASPVPEAVPAPEASAVHASPTTPTNPSVSWVVSVGEGYPLCVNFAKAAQGLNEFQGGDLSFLEGKPNFKLLRWEKLPSDKNLMYLKIYIEAKNDAEFSDRIRGINSDRGISFYYSEPINLDKRDEVERIMVMKFSDFILRKPTEIMQWSGSIVLGEDMNLSREYFKEQRYPIFMYGGIPYGALLTRKGGEIFRIGSVDSERRGRLVYNLICSINRTMI
ncbi:MAG: hypothetical protein ACOY3X_01445 [Pseudomonadota bacterium]